MVKYRGLLCGLFRENFVIPIGLKVFVVRRLAIFMKKKMYRLLVKKYFS